MATTKRTPRTPAAGPVRIIRQADAAEQTADPAPIVAALPEGMSKADRNAVARMAATALLAAMRDPLSPEAVQAAMGPAKLRERAKGAAPSQRGPKGPDWQWPESLRETARSLEPKFALNYGRSSANGHLPYGKPNKPDMESLSAGIINPIPTETRAILSAQIIIDFINGSYNGIVLSRCMADGESMPLVWLLEIMGFNLDTYRSVEAWQTLSKLLARIAQATGRYCLIDKEGNLSLSITPPQSDDSAAD